MPKGKGSVAVVALFGAVVVAVTVPVWPARPAAAGVPVVEIDGRGWGHGVGLAQDGALEMGRRGASLGQILGQFYPGTGFGRATGEVRVAVLTAGAPPAAETVTFPDGGQVLDTTSGPQSPGFPITVAAGGAITITWNGARYAAGPAVTTGAAAPASPAPTLLPPLLTTTTRPPPTTTTTTVERETTSSTPSPRRGPTSQPPPVPSAAGATSARPLWAVPQGGGVLGVPARDRTYRGVMEAVGGPAGLRLVNQLDVETYLVGMGEVLDPAWPLASLEAQEVAARTYAMRAMASGGELCDDTRCQVYIGTAGEYPLAEQAVAGTASEVLFEGSAIADAVYSANAAGYTATPEEGFGNDTPSFPYLRPAPYPTGDQMAWSVQIANRDVADRLGISGPIDDLAVATKGPSGRALSIRVRSGQTTTVVSGLDFAAALGLKSTMIDAIRDATATAAPPPPPNTSGIQVLPDATGQLIPAPLSPATTSPPVRGRMLAPPVLSAGPNGSDRAGVPLALIATAAALVALTGAAAYRLRRPRSAG